MPAEISTSTTNEWRRWRVHATVKGFDDEAEDIDEVRRRA